MDVLVVGGGIAGIKAAIDLAEFGYHVHLIDGEPWVGGKLIQHRSWYPTNSCGLCKILPKADYCDQCLRRGLSHPNIDVITNGVIKSFEGTPGNFKVGVERESTYVIAERCVSCGLCEQPCPVEVENEYNPGFPRKAIYTNPALSTYVIDGSKCTKCGKCAEACPTGAVALDARPKLIELSVGAVVLSMGTGDYDPRELREYGYTLHPNILTNTQFERLLNETGPTGGELKTPYDGRAPQKIGFIQCVGSRNEDRDYCSATCCMMAIKEALMAKDLDPGIEAKIFYIDLRVQGKGHQRYLDMAQEKGIEFVRFRVPAVEWDGGELSVRYQSGGEMVKERFDLIVLSVGQVVTEEAVGVADLMGVGLGEYGFCNGTNSPGETSRKGVYACGSFREPKGIPESLVEGSAAAASVAVFLVNEKTESTDAEKAGKEIEKAGKEITKEEEEEKEGEEVEEEEARIGVFAHGGSGKRGSGKLSGEPSRGSLLEHARTLKNVVHVGGIPFPGFEGIRDDIQNHDLNRIILLTPSPSLRRDSMASALGLYPAYTEVLHLEETGLSEARSGSTLEGSMLECAVEKLRFQSPPHISRENVIPRALVVGGGIAGLTVANTLAKVGIGVDLLERTGELGGKLRDIHYSIEGYDPQEILRCAIKDAESDPSITIYNNGDLIGVEGHAGNFRTTVGVSGEEIKLDHGAIVVATGCEEYGPTEYLYGSDGRVMTQLELENLLASGKRVPAPVVMIQCVGSRDEERPYCSRICCSQALKNGLKLKEVDPDTEIYIIYRDMMSYGLMERHYSRAREAGINFICYDEGRKPRVGLDKNELFVRVWDRNAEEELTLTPGTLILSTGLVAAKADNRRLAETLGIALDEDGFFQETDDRFQPLCGRDGVFICGPARSPSTLLESITQAMAASAGVYSILAKGATISRNSVAKINERRCSGCWSCINSCPFDAIVWVKERRVARVLETLCRGCGICAMICPNGAPTLGEYGDKQMVEMIDVLV